MGLLDTLTSLLERANLGEGAEEAIREGDVGAGIAEAAEETAEDATGTDSMSGSSSPQ
jgi:hypothetical protein